MIPIFIARVQLQRSEADLAVNILRGFRFIAAAKPDSNLIAIKLNGGIAHDFGIPWKAPLRTGCSVSDSRLHRLGTLLSRAGDTPVRRGRYRASSTSPAVPDSRFAQPDLIEHAGASQSKNRVAAILRPGHAIVRARQLRAAADGRGPRPRKYM